MLRDIIKHLPHFLRKKITQKHLTFSVDSTVYQFKIADSIDEIEQAAKILYDSYVKAGFMQKNIENIRILPQFFLPSTAIFVIKEGNQVIGTSSLIRDNPFGLPMEKIFNLFHLRNDGKRLTEISSLAIHADHRKKGGVVFHEFIRFMWNHALDYQSTEMFVIAVNPSMVQFYEDLYLFKKIPNANIHKKYDFVNGAPAVGLYFNTQSSKQIFSSEYNNKPIDKNLYKYMFESGKNLFEHIENLNPEFYDMNCVGSSQILQYFLDNYKEWWNALDSASKIEFIKLQNSFGRDEINYPGLYLTSSQRQLPRFDSSLKIISSAENNGIIFDVSLVGIKIRKYNPEANKAVQALVCQAGPQKTIKLKVESVWENSNFLGAKILDADSDWERYIKFINEKINNGIETKDSKSRRLKVA